MSREKRRWPALFRLDVTREELSFKPSDGGRVQAGEGDESGKRHHLISPYFRTEEPDGSDWPLPPQTQQSDAAGGPSASRALRREIK